MNGKAELPLLIDRRPVLGETKKWLDQVAGIAPVIEKLRDEGELERTTSRPVYEALRGAGIHRMAVSREFGGAQLELATATAVISELARLDPSVAWQMGVQAAISRLSDYLPEPVARRIFQEQQDLAIGSVNPTGRAEAVEGGYRLDGTWAFASGSAYADWFVCAAVVFADGAPRQTEFGPEIRMMFVPRTSVRLRDTWHTLGLRATNSRHYDVEDQFVTADHTVAMADMVLPPAPRPSRAYAISYYDFGLFGSASTVLGIAQGALEAFKELALAKTPTAGTGTLATSHVTQEKLGRAEILTRSAALLLGDAAWHASEHGADGGDSLSATLRLSAATIAENSAAAVDILFTLAGSSSLYTDSLLERYFRDVHTAVKHITLSPTNIEMTGQYLLGNGLKFRR